MGTNARGRDHEARTESDQNDSRLERVPHDDGFAKNVCLRNGVVQWRKRKNVISTPLN